MGYIDPPPKGNNSLSQPYLFEERAAYKEKSFSHFFDPIPLDTIYEKPYYGKVDIYGDIIYPSESEMVQLPGPGLILTHAFVADAFGDLKNYMDKAISAQHNIFNDLFETFVPRSATANIHQLYNDHFVKNIFDVFINDYVVDPKINKKIKNFNDMIEEFLSYAKIMSDQFPITRAAFITSPLCPNSISGLFIELETMSHDDDLAKYEKYLSKPSFDRYARAVPAFGFYIDKNAPWRIAVNMDSPKTKEYMSRYKVDVKDNTVFSKYFYKAEYYSYEALKRRLWNMYSTLLANESTSTHGTEYKIKNCIGATWNDVENNKYKTLIVKKLRESIPPFEAEASTTEVSEHVKLIIAASKKIQATGGLLSIPAWLPAFFSPTTTECAPQPSIISEPSSESELLPLAVPMRPPPGPFEEKYPDEYFLPFYLRLRLLETKTKFTRSKYVNVLKKILDINKVYGIDRALEQIGRLVKPTRIYEKAPPNAQTPQKIKYFGKGVSSGLHSYYESDTMIQEKIKESKTLQTAELIG